MTQSRLIPIVGMLCGAIVGCQRESADSGAVLSDSAYVHAMGALRRVYDDRAQHPAATIPMPLGPGGTAPTPTQVRHRDSSQHMRIDSVRTVDSIARRTVLARFHVTESRLRETARALAQQPEKSQRVMQAVGLESARLESARLDSLARAATLKAARESTSKAP